MIGGGDPFAGPGAAGRQTGKGTGAADAPRSPRSFTNTYLYDPVSNSWTTGPSLNTARSFADAATVNTAGGQTAVVVAGYNSTQGTSINVVERSTLGGCPSPTPTPTAGTPTPTPTCVPGTPGPWSTATPYPITDVRYGFAQTATHFYVFGGVSGGTRVPDVNRLDLATGMWQSRASMPFSSEAPTCALMASTGIVYCTEGDTGSGFASYNIATNTWTPLASIPGGDHYGSASGAFNGKVFVAGGTTGIGSAVQVYDVATNTWSAGTAAPSAFLLAGYQQVGQFLYVVGGFSPGGPNAAQQSSVLTRGQQSQQPKVPLANNTTTFRLDMSSAPGVWTPGPAFTQGRADFGVAYDAGTNKLYALGGDSNGGGFFDSTNLVDELSVASWPAGSWVASPPNLILPNRQANQAGFYGGGQIWSVGGIVGQTFQFLAEVQRRSNGGGPCGTPTATPTGTPPATPTSTPTAIPSATPTASPTCTPGGGQITTLFASNNNGNPGGALYFDLTVAANPISVTALDINTAFTGSFSNFQVWVLPGMTFQGNETNMALWTQVATGSGTGAGLDQPTHVTLSNPVTLNAGTLYGIALVADPAFEHRYTNGTGSNQNYSNADLSLFLGSATNVPFTAPVFFPRVWNGTIYYGGPCGSPTPTPTATGTPSATPTCPPGGSPGPWTQAAPVGIDHYGGFMDSDGTFAYEGGGYSFSTSDNINEFGKFDPVANTWTPLAPVPDLTNGMASGVYAPNVNKLFVFGGSQFSTGIVVNTTRIYDILTNTWSTGAPMPDIRAFMGSGYHNGKIYLVGGYTTGNVDPSFGQVWEYDPVLNTWNTTRMSMPITMGGPGFGIINGHIYIAGGRNLANTNLNTLYDYDIAANTWTARANLPSGVNVPGSAVIAGKLWVFGGGNPFTGPGTSPTSANKGVRAWLKRLFSPDTTNALQLYDPATNTWTSGPTLNQQRSFPAGTHVGNTAIAVGGYTGSSTTASVEINVAGGGCPSPTPTATATATGTPSATPTCTPGGSPGPWSTATPYPITDVRYGFAQTATHFYVFGGVSGGTRVPDVNRLDLATGMWQSRAAMPFSSEAPTCALMASTGIVYCTEGDTGSGFASYNIATNTWTPLASIPGGDHYGSASGAFNGKVFVAGGTTGIGSAVQVYDVATNTWSAGTAAPSAFLLAGYQQVGQFLYVVGGFSPGGPNAAEQSSVLTRGQQSQQPKVPLANNTTTFRLDMSSAPGVWTPGPAFTQGRADFGVAYDAGTNKLYALGGDSNGGGFFDSTNLVDELSVASWPAGSWVASPPNLILPNRQANQAGFYGGGQIWSVGGIVGQTFQFLAEVQRRSNGGGPCGTPTATPTATAHIHSDGNCDGNSHIHANSDCDSDIYCNGYGHGDRYSNGNSNQTAAVYTDAATSSDTAAACGQLLFR